MVHKGGVYKIVRKMYFVLVVILIMSATMPIVNAKKVADGTCGDNVTWSLDETGMLLINGKGAIDNYRSTDPPWYNYSLSINSVVIEDGIKRIGECAFFGFSNMTKVSIPESVVDIGSLAFDLCEKLTDVYYDGPDTQWAVVNKHANRYLTVNENINMHYNNDTKFAKTPRLTEYYAIDVAFRDIDSPCVLVTTFKKGEKVLWTDTKDVEAGTSGLWVHPPGNYFDEATEVNMYIWKDLDSMQPLCKGKTIELE